MNTQNFKMVRTLFMVFAASLIFATCSDDEGVSNETFDSNVLRVLKVSANDELLEDQATGVQAFNLEIEIVFSTAINESDLVSALSLSNDASFISSLDETNSILTLSLETLDYEAEYTLNLPAGSYGTDGQAIANDYSLTFTTSPFIIPGVELSVSASSFDESSSVTVTAILSQVTSEDVTVSLEYSGSATLDSDFSAANQIVVPALQESASIDITGLDDSDVEGQELFTVSISSITNGTEVDEQFAEIAINDNDILADLEIKGVLAVNWTTETDGNSGKAIHLRATADIPDLSVYGLGVANNGGGTDGEEYEFPAMSASEGDDILVARDQSALSSYFGSLSEFEIVLDANSSISQNGDDAIELFSGPVVIETIGDSDVDGTGQSWEYTGSWAYKLGDSFIYGGVDCTSSSGPNTTQESACIYPMFAPAMLFKGAMEMETNGGLKVRAYHLQAYQDIPDLSIYSVEIYNNGNPPPAFAVVSLPSESATEGEDILVVRDEDAGDVGTYFGTCANKFTIYESPDVTSNGDDALVLFENTTEIGALGEIGVDGTGQSWDYTNSFGYQPVAGAGFTFPGADCTSTGTSNSDSPCGYPFCND